MWVTALQLRLLWDTTTMPVHSLSHPPGVLHPPCLLHHHSMVVDELVYSKLSVPFLYFSVLFFFSFWRDPRSDVVVSHPFFELSWWSLTLYFNELFPSYHCFFIWTYRAKAICSMTPFKVSENHPGWIWTTYLFVMLQLVALVMIIMCHKENILSLCTEQAARTF